MERKATGWFVIETATIGHEEQAIMTPDVIILVLLGSYLLGSLPTSWIVGKVFFGLDLRRHGSGNVGATNALRVLGKKAGVFVLVVDVLKGTAAVLAAAQANETWEHHSPMLLPILAGGAAVVGHMYTLWLRFKGGKGVATAAGVFLALSPWALGGCVLLFIVVVATTRYVSLGSVLAALLIGPLARWESGSWTSPVTLFALFAGALVIIRHRDNVRRLIAGTEPPVDSTPKGEGVIS